MKRYEMIVRMVLFLVAGLVFGAAVTMYAYTKYLTENVYYARPSLESLNAIAALQFVRGGQKEKAIELLEWQLDEGLLGLTIYVNGDDDLASKPPVVRAAVAQARAYRKRHPRRLEVKELDESVRRLLSGETDPSLEEK